MVCFVEAMMMALKTALSQRPMKRLIAKLGKTLQLRGWMIELEIGIPEDSGATHWTHKLLEKATNVGTFQSLKWKDGVAKCIEGCSGIELDKIKKLYAGSLGPQNNKDYLPSIRVEFLNSGLQLDAAEGLENLGITAMKDITEDQILRFEKENEAKTTNVKSVANKVRAVFASKKEATQQAKENAAQAKQDAAQAKKDVEAAEQARKQDIAKRQALAQASILASEKQTTASIKASLDILESLDVTELMKKDSKAVEEKLKRLTDLVKQSAEFDAAGKHFKGSDTLLAGLTGGALSLPPPQEEGMIKAYEENEELVASVSGGLALHGICLLLEDEPIISSTMPTLKTPESVAMLGVETPFMSSTFKSTQESEIIRFNTTATSGGMSMAESSTSSWGISAEAQGYGAEGSAAVAKGTSLNDSISKQRAANMANTNKKTTSTAHIIEYIKMPMRSFRIPGNALRLSVDVEEAVRNVRTERQALTFLRAYGSHIPFGIHTVGGVFFRKISVTSSAQVDSVSLFQAAGDQISKEKGDSSSSSVSAGGSYMGVTASASASMSQGSRTGSSTFNASAQGSEDQSNKTSMFFESSVMSMGPNAPTPESFASMLSQNSGTWAVIDRGKLDQLKPIWAFIKDDILAESKRKSLTDSNSEVAQLEKAIRMMKRVWLRRVENTTNFPRLPILVWRLIDDSIAEKMAILNMVKSICSVISPTPGTGTSLTMLENLQTVVEAACEKMDEGSFTFSDIKTFIDLGSKTDGLSFTFEVMESDASTFRLTDPKVIRADKLIRAAGIAAKTASKDIDWCNLSEEFLYFARDSMELPYFRGDNTIVLFCKPYHTERKLEGIVKVNDISLKVAHGTTLHLLSADGISPVIVQVTPPYWGPPWGPPVVPSEDPNSLRPWAPKDYDLYPGGIYYWKFMDQKDPKTGHEIVNEVQFLAAGNVVLTNTCDVDALQYGLGEFGVAKRSSGGVTPYYYNEGAGTRVKRELDDAFPVEFWWVPGRPKKSISIKVGYKYYICPQAFNPHYALCAPRILNQEEMDSENEVRSSQPVHDYFGGKFTDQVVISNFGSLLELGVIGDSKPVPAALNAVSNLVLVDERRWNITRTTSPFLKGDKGCYTIKDGRGFCLKTESGSDGVSMVVESGGGGSQKWRFMMQSRGGIDSGIYLIVNAVSGRRLYADQADGLRATDPGVVSENQKWYITRINGGSLVTAMDLPTPAVELDRDGEENHDYRVGEQVLLKVDAPKEVDAQWTGPYPILTVHVNGTLTIRLSALTI